MPQEDMKNIIKVLLEEKHLSIGKAERLGGIGSGAVRNFLLGKTKNLSFDTINALASVLGCSPARLISQDHKAGTFLPWKCKIFLDALLKVDSFITENKKNMLTKDVIELANEIYQFSYNNDDHVNEEFSQWFLRDRMMK